MYKTIAYICNKSFVVTCKTAFIIMQKRFRNEFLESSRQYRNLQFRDVFNTTCIKKHMFPKNKTFWDFHHLLRSFKGYLLVGKFVNLPIVNPFMSFMALYEGHVKTKVMASFTSFHLCVCFGF